MVKVGYYNYKEQLVIFQPMIHIGLGQMQMLQDMEIQWPNGRSKRLKTVKADQLITLVEE
ncbi:MAG: ASPIC/UnbV domain-containing protein [Candidatus Poribacteria bacterium]|nr:ASPIC/UnbV domain-containing protein [Candidatus Poribacteria bacterium]